MLRGSVLGLALLCFVMSLNAAMEIVSIEIISAPPGGGSANGSSLNASITPDGRYIVYNSSAQNLISGRTIYGTQIYFYDRITGETRLVSQNSSGQPGNRVSEAYDARNSISADGRYVVFGSYATNLHPDKTLGNVQIFLWDRDTGSIDLISRGMNGHQVNNDCFDPAISGDGRYISYNALATNIVPNDTNGRNDAILYDRETKSTMRANMVDGLQCTDMTALKDHALSFDGRYLVMRTGHTRIDSPSGARAICVYDRITGEHTAIDISSSGERSDNPDSMTVINVEPAMADNGRYVAFSSLSTNLVPNDNNSSRDIFVRDIEAGTTTRVSVASDGTESNGDSVRPFISSDGRFVCYVSTSTNLSPNDSDMGKDIYMHDCQTGETILVSQNMDGIAGTSNSRKPAVSADGRWVVFDSYSGNLVPEDTNYHDDIFLVQLSMDDPTKWASYPIDQDTMDVDTGDFLGLINVKYGDFVWSYTTESWLYCSEDYVGETGGWVYFPKVTD
ncbi:MAG: TolB family protein [Puniceicoccaceae bacterium]